MTVPTQGPGLANGYRPDSAPEVTRQSLGDLMRHVTEDLSTLMRQEIELAKAELRQEGSKAGRAAGFFGGAGFGGYMVLLFLSLALWGGLSNVMDSGWAALIVAVVWVVVAAVLYAKGKSQAARVRGLTKTTETMHRIPEALKPDREGVTR
ncbi:phage holin family protein [Micromonospora echinofusca]|uniref:Phage holin family protein n=1 Tax=Micromonospora echinofusca TaxID=47858 RepID=A0ABS3VX96_MICEH|nr:phage holin family protein [Micromonospora echinofusca]MBO4209165.1 phage holin family protein [Micromonospora echinofusca]